MRTLIAAVLMLAMLAAAGARAQDRPPDSLPEPLPPPELLPEPLEGEDPATATTLVDDVDAAPPSPPPEAAASAARGAPAADPDALPPKVLAPDEPAPAVTIRTDPDSGDVIEEYRQNGVVYMVRVRPQRGPEYTLQDTNGDGRLDDNDFEGPVRPVYWTLYEWE